MDKSIVQLAVFSLLCAGLGSADVYGTDSREVVDVCSLPPADPGDCDGVFPKWTFDGTACVLFDYGGCGGNDNRFETREECEAACPPVDVCSLPLVTGPCRASIPSWGFQDGACVEFTYGGCQGNNNRFETKVECEKACPPEDVCSLPLVTGPCEALIKSWGFKDGACVEFIYGGCQGNENRFETREDCEKACPPEDVCSLPLVPGPCRGSFPSWGFQDGACVEFIYGGCQGNENRFETREECEKACPPVDTCSLPLVTGPCEAAIQSWGFQDGACVEFVYGGCQGNNNRFETKEECERACPPVDTCSLPLVPGPCRGSFPRWGFKDGACVEFIYGGCQGNENRFETREECENACPPVDVCSLPLVPGPCKAYHPSWGFKDGACEEFIYGGCQGNENRFATKEDCEKACPPTDVCSLPLVKGPCRAVECRWGFQDGVCQPFQYGGCDGNDNNFLSQSDCREACPEKTERPAQCFNSCHPSQYWCNYRRRRWVYDIESDECVQRCAGRPWDLSHRTIGYGSKRECEGDCVV